MLSRDAMLMARLEGRELNLKLERTSLADIVEAALRELGTVTARHPVEVKVPRDLPLVSVEAGLIQRVFTSLIGNVVKHTPAGTHIAIAARIAGEFVEASVEDDGPGLPEGRENELFATFARGETQPTRRGAGLGLAICRAIVEAHGGAIHAERIEPRGTRVVFTLPAKRA